MYPLFLYSTEKRRPRFSFYPALAMGLIQPEWLYMYHHLKEEREAELSGKISEGEKTESANIRINIRPRRRNPATTAKAGAIHHRTDRSSPGR
ncbi:hypothetical protein C8P63_1127 [Melghirimyces profundicolus]|uniref:Uncharacterized protein n=1 Tax=Melghirimyces profundicolus TaxID=1242148 RepID=A0A2T6BTC4_9BACL|nr:hypothetical protein [Melghirimyces profundicolus]PTX59313.1 hypothetical protein C8P63_1127 [Melghirimyces profundicolus]